MFSADFTIHHNKGRTNDTVAAADESDKRTCRTDEESFLINQNVTQQHKCQFNRGNGY